MVDCTQVRLISHNGRLMTGTKHTASSEYLTHTKPKGRKKK